MIYNTRKACCSKNFLYSEICDLKVGTDPPTKHPTIARPDDDFEIVPISFDFLGVPDFVSVRDLKDELKRILRQILTRLSGRIDGLRITEIEERVPQRRLREALLATRADEDEVNEEMIGVLREGKGGGRELEQYIQLFFNIHAVRDPEMKFGPLIVEEITDSYDEIIEKVQ